MKRLRSVAGRSIISVLVLSALFSISACDRQKSEVKASIDKYFKAFGARDIKYETYATDPNYPNKAYYSLVVTWNHANRHGEFEKEYIGCLLDRNGDNWTVEVKGMPYTNDREQAISYLSGRAK